VRAATAGWRSSTAPSLFLKDIVTLLPLEQTVVEIPETVQPGDCVIAACNRLKPSGYLIALDDFAPNDARLPLCDFAKIIKIDFPTTAIGERADLIRRLGSAKRRMFAEKRRHKGCAAKSWTREPERLIKQEPVLC